MSFIIPAILKLQKIDFDANQLKALGRVIQNETNINPRVITALSEAQRLIQQISRSGKDVSTVINSAAGAMQLLGKEGQEAVQAYSRLVGELRKIGKVGIDKTLFAGVDLGTVGGRKTLADRLGVDTKSLSKVFPVIERELFKQIETGSARASRSMVKNFDFAKRQLIKSYSELGRTLDKQLDFAKKTGTPNQIISDIERRRQALGKQAAGISGTERPEDFKKIISGTEKFRQMRSRIDRESISAQNALNAEKLEEVKIQDFITKGQKTYIAATKARLIAEKENTKELEKQDRIRGQKTQAFSKFNDRAQTESEKDFERRKVANERFIKERRRQEEQLAKDSSRLDTVDHKEDISGIERRSKFLKQLSTETSKVIKLQEALNDRYKRSIELQQKLGIAASSLSKNSVIEKFLATDPTKVAQERLGAAGAADGAIFSDADLRNQARSLRDNNKELTSLISKRSSIEDFGEKAALAFKRFGAFVLGSFGIYRVITAFQNASREALEFEKRITRIQQVIGQSVVGVRGIQEAIISASRFSGVLASDIAAGVEIFAQAGFKNVDELSHVAEQLAKIPLAPTFDDIKSSAEGLLAVQKQFNKDLSDTAGILDLVNQFAADFAVESADIFEGVKRGGAAFATAGGQFEDFISLFSLLRDASRESAETLGTFFKTGTAQLLSPKSQAVIQQLIGPLENGDNLIDQLNELAEVMFGPNSSLSEIDKIRIAVEVTGERQFNRLLALLRELNKEQQLGSGSRVAIALEKAAGSLDRALGARLDDIGTSINRVKTAFNQLTIEFSQNEAIKRLVQTFSSLAISVIDISKGMSGLFPLMTSLTTLALAPAASKFFSGFRSLLFGGTPELVSRQLSDQASTRFPTNGLAGAAFNAQLSRQQQFVREGQRSFKASQPGLNIDPTTVLLTTLPFIIGNLLHDRNIRDDVAGVTGLSEASVDAAGSVIQLGTVVAILARALGRSGLTSALLGASAALFGFTSIIEQQRRQELEDALGQSKTIGQSINIIQQSKFANLFGGTSTAGRIQGGILGGLGGSLAAGFINRSERFRDVPGLRRFASVGLPLAGGAFGASNFNLDVSRGQFGGGIEQLLLSALIFNGKDVLRGLGGLHNRVTDSNFSGLRSTRKGFGRASRIIGKAGSRIPLIGAGVSLGASLLSGTPANEAIGGAAGGGLGGLIGGLLGSFLGPAGTIVGGFSGAGIGDFLGRKLGSNIGNKPSALDSLSTDIRAGKADPVLIKQLDDVRKSIGDKLSKELEIIDVGDPQAVTEIAHRINFRFIKELEKIPEIGEEFGTEIGSAFIDTTQKTLEEFITSLSKDLEAGINGFETSGREMRQQFLFLNTKWQKANEQFKDIGNVLEAFSANLDATPVLRLGSKAQTALKQVPASALGITTEQQDFLINRDKLLRATSKQIEALFSQEGSPIQLVFKSIVEAISSDTEGLLPQTLGGLFGKFNPELLSQTPELQNVLRSLDEAIALTGDIGAQTAVQVAELLANTTGPIEDVLKDLFGQEIVDKFVELANTYVEAINAQISKVQEFQESIRSSNQSLFDITSTLDELANVSSQRQLQQSLFLGRTSPVESARREASRLLGTNVFRSSSVNASDAVSLARQRVGLLGTFAEQQRNGAPIDLALQRDINSTQDQYLSLQQNLNQRLSEFDRNIGSVSSAADILRDTFLNFEADVQGAGESVTQLTQKDLARSINSLQTFVSAGGLTSAGGGLEALASDQQFADLKNLLGIAGNINLGGGITGNQLLGNINQALGLPILGLIRSTVTGESQGQAEQAIIAELERIKQEQAAANALEQQLRNEQVKLVELQRELVDIEKQFFSNQLLALNELLKAIPGVSTEVIDKLRTESTGPIPFSPFTPRTIQTPEVTPFPKIPGTNIPISPSLPKFPQTIQIPGITPTIDPSKLPMSSSDFDKFSNKQIDAINIQTEMVGSLVEKLDTQNETNTIDTLNNIAQLVQGLLDNTIIIRDSVSKLVGGAQFTLQVAPIQVNVALTAPDVLKLIGPQITTSIMKAIGNKLAVVFNDDPERLGQISAAFNGT